MLGANVTSSTTPIYQDEKELKCHVLTCCLRNFSRSEERRRRRVAISRQNWCCHAYHDIYVSIVIVIISVGILVGIQDTNNEPDPSDISSAEISATSPANLYTATRVASFMDSPTSSPVSISSVSPTTLNTNADTPSPVLGVICDDDTAAVFLREQSESRLRLAIRKSRVSSTTLSTRTGRL